MRDDCNETKGKNSEEKWAVEAEQEEEEDEEIQKIKETHYMIAPFSLSCSIVSLRS